MDLKFKEEHASASKISALILILSLSVFSDFGFCADTLVSDAVTTPTKSIDSQGEQLQIVATAVATAINQGATSNFSFSDSPLIVPVERFEYPGRAEWSTDELFFQNSLTEGQTIEANKSYAFLRKVDPSAAWFVVFDMNANGEAINFRSSGWGLSFFESGEIYQPNPSADQGMNTLRNPLTGPDTTAINDFKNQIAAAQNAFLFPPISSGNSNASNSNDGFQAGPISELQINTSIKNSRAETFQAINLVQNPNLNPISMQNLWKNLNISIDDKNSLALTLGGITRLLRFTSPSEFGSVNFLKSLKDYIKQLADLAEKYKGREDVQKSIDAMITNIFAQLENQAGQKNLGENKSDSELFEEILLLNQQGSGNSPQMDPKQMDQMMNSVLEVLRQAATNENTTVVQRTMYRKWYFSLAKKARLVRMQRMQHLNPAARSKQPEKSILSITEK